MVVLQNNSVFDYDFGNWSANASVAHGMSTQSVGSSSDACKLFLFIFFTVITGLLCILGFIGNVISMLVLQKDRGGRVHAATFLLQALAVADNCVLGVSLIFLCVIYGLLPMFNAGVLRRRMIPYIVTYIEPIAHMGQTATVWMTVLLAVNRFIAICRPFDTHRLATLKKTKIQVAVVFIFAIILNFPRFFQNKIVYRQDPSGYNSTIPYHVQTSIGTRTVFGMVYTTWFYTVIVLLLPMFLLVVLNTRLILELRKMSARRDSIQHDERRSEENITLVMIVIIIVFIICNTPDRINQVVKHFIRTKPCSGWFYFDCVSQFFVVANSSTNFLVYYVFRRRFRQVLLQKLCHATPSNGAYEYGMNGQSNYTTDRRQTMTLLSTNGITYQSQVGDMQTVV